MSIEKDLIKKGQEIYNGLGLELTQGMCEPVKSEDETVAEIIESGDEVAQAVVEKDETIDFVSKESTATQIVETAPTLAAPHTGFQSGVTAGLGLIGLSVAIAVTAISIKK